MKYLLLCVALFAYVDAAELPTYVSKCCINAHECILAEVRRVILTVLRGDSKYNVPSFLPYSVSEISLLNNEAGTFLLRPLQLWHLDTITINSLKLYYDKGYGECEYHFLRLKLEFTYDINIFNTPLHKSRSGKIILDDVTVKHKASFDIDDELYAYATESSVTFTAGSIVYDLQGLDDEAKEYLEDNYDYVNELMKPGLEKFLNSVVLRPYTGYAQSIKLTNVFKPLAEC